MKRLLWVGDAACPSGFARATHEILDKVRLSYEVTVLGLNYRGDPYDYPYKIYACQPGGDSFGIGRLVWMCDLVKPDIIVLQNDPWNIPLYLQQLQRFKEYKDVPVVAAVAVDGKNCLGEGLNGLAKAVFWTKFGLEEAQLGGYKGKADVIPLGVDITTYFPMDRYEARKRRGISVLKDAFIVGNVNRNQPRKRWDLTIRYFAEWIRQNKVKDAFLFLHVAPTGDMGVDVKGLAKYYGVLDRIALSQPETWYGLPDSHLCEIYNCFDVAVSTTQGEGFGLTALEAMACGIPPILPDWAALGEWAEGAAWMVPCTSTAIGPPYVNVLGGVPDEDKFIKALQTLYANKAYRETNGRAALERAEEDRFRWANVANAWVKSLDGVFAEEAVAV